MSAPQLAIASLRIHFDGKVKRLTFVRAEEGIGKGESDNGGYGENKIGKELALLEGYYPQRKKRLASSTCSS